MPEEGKPLTQEAFDKLYGELKAKEKDSKDTLEKIIAKLDKSEKEKVEILAKVVALEKTAKPVKKEEEEIVEYTEENPPQSDDEWNEFFYRNPTAAADLRTTIKGKHIAYENTWRKTQQECIDELVRLHPDMYKKNDKGEVQKDKDGHPIFDPDSDKGKIWIEIAGNDPAILRAATGARIVREAMESRLKGKAEDIVKKELEDKKKKEEDERQAKVKAGQVAAGGGNPNPEPEVEVKFNSKEEEAYAEDGIKRGIFKDKKHYIKAKNSAIIGYGRGGF